MNYHYVLMNALIDEYKTQGFDIVGFPCNQFQYQEPGAGPAEILNGIKHVRPGGGYVPNFNLTQKVDLNGDPVYPLYGFLKGACPLPVETIGTRLNRIYDPIRVHDLTWNFEKFLIDKWGKPRWRYIPATEPSDPDFKKDLEALLAESSPPY